MNVESIKPHMPVVCSEGGQFAVVDHLEGASSIKLAKDKSGQHHFIPLSWVTLVDDKVHIDRPGDEAMRLWATEPNKLAHKDPSWWNESHSSGWDRAKDALRRDWEQTKADVGAGGHELKQGVSDTVKQAAGKEAIPPRNAPNQGGWKEQESALRYGYGARQYYAKDEWNDELEGKLRKDWESSGTGGTWDRVKSSVRRGWESVKHVAD